MPAHFVRWEIAGKLYNEKMYFVLKNSNGYIMYNAVVCTQKV